MVPPTLSMMAWKAGTPSSARSATTTAPPRGTFIGDTVGKLGEVVLGDNIGRISDDRSSGDHDSYRSWARRQSSERTDQSGNDSAAMAALVIS